jgi:Kef-type K+ transport system membrane component KefB
MVLVLALAFAGYRRSFVQKHWPVWARFFFLTGMEFILLGLALGESFIGLLDRETVGRLGPLFSLGLGYFGLILGLQFEYRKLRQFPLRFMTASVLQAVTAFAVVFAVFGLLLFLIRSLAFAALFTLSAVACCSSPALAALLAQKWGAAKSRTMELVRYIAGFDSVIGLTLLGVAACFTSAAPYLATAFLPPFFQWLALSILLGGAIGSIIHLLTRHCTQGELWVFTIGSITFGGGASLYFGLSPLFINMVAGIAAANLPGSKDRVFMALFSQEKPFYIVFLTLAGALWQPASMTTLYLAIVYMLSRIIGKLAGGFLAARVAGKGSAFTPWVGAGLISQGGIAVAMAVEIYLSQSSWGSSVASFLITAVIINEVASPAMAAKLAPEPGKGET